MIQKSNKKMLFSKVVFALATASVALGTVTLQNVDSSVQVRVDDTPKQQILGADEASKHNIVPSALSSVVDEHKIQKVVRKIMRLREEVATLENIAVSSVSTKPVVIEEQQPCEGKKCKKNKKNKKDKKVKIPKESKDSKILAKKKAELALLETEFATFGKIYDEQVALVKALDAKTVNKKTIKQELKQLALGWEAVWATHPDNNGMPPEPEFSSSVDAVKYKILKLEYKLSEQKAKLQYLVEEEAKNQVQVLTPITDDTEAKPDVAIEPAVTES